MFVCWPEWLCVSLLSLWGSPWFFGRVHFIPLTIHTFFSFQCSYSLHSWALPKRGIFVDPHLGLVFFICCRSHFLPSGGLLKSQMLLPGWVVSESGSGLEMPWGGDTCGRIFIRAFGLLEWSLRILLKCEGDPPLSYHESRPDGMGSHEAEGLMSAAAGVQQ